MKRVYAVTAALCAFVAVAIFARAQSTTPPIRAEQLPATPGDIQIIGSGFRATIIPGRSITIYADHKRVNVRPAVVGDETVVEVNTSPQLIP